MNKYRLVIQVRPWRETEEPLEQVIVFKEGEKYHLAGWEQLGKKLLEILAEVENQEYKTIRMELEIKEGDETEAGIVSDILRDIEVT